MADSIEDKDNVLFKKLRKLITLVDQLRDVGVHEYIKLPRIASLGTQSSGKSAVLESIVGLDFLPRGDGVVTRRPLELRLCHISEGEPYAYFEEVKGKKFTDFIEVRKTIERLTDEVCVGDKNIVDKPIVLNVYSQTCPDLTLIDLPGITRVPIGNQPKNIEEITKNMAKRYCEDSLTVILCVIAANSDIATIDGLKMAKELDVQGVRTLGVLTKLDIMDKGTDAKKALLNEEIPLKLGYVAVKNRSKQDLIDKIPMKDAFAKEKSFFSNHPVYSTLSSTYYGTDVLIQKLTKILFKIIREHLPTIIRAIDDNINKCKEELILLGTPMPTDEGGKLTMLWNMLSEYCETYKNVLAGQYDLKRQSFLREEGGYKLKALFKNLLEQYIGDYKVTADLKDSDIENALSLHNEGSLAGFVSIQAFTSLLKPKLALVKEPIDQTFANVFSYLEMISSKILERIFSRFPRIINSVGDLVQKFLNQEKEKAKYMVDCIVEMDLNILFTNDDTYIQSQGGVLGVGDKGLVQGMRSRVEAYFKLCVKNLRDSIPKAIGYNLVQSIQDNMEMYLYKALYDNKEIVEVLNEPEGIKRKRIELNRQIKVLREAQKVIKKDPDLVSAIQVTVPDV